MLKTAMSYITSQVISGIMPTNVGHILWQVPVHRNVLRGVYLGTHPVKGKCWTYPVAGVPRNATGSLIRVSL